MLGTTQGTDPRQGRTAVTNTARPLTQVGSPSSAGTTFTKTSVTDSAAWDLSAVAVGMIIKTSDGFRGSITGVNDGTNTITCEGGWISAGGRSGRGLAAQIPADGAIVRVHKMESCELLIVDALDENTLDVYLGFSSSVSADPASANVGHEIAASVGQVNHRLVMEARMSKEFDLTEFWVIVASGTEYVCWIGM